MSMKQKTASALSWWAIMLFVLGFWSVIGFVAYHFLSRWW